MIKLSERARQHLALHFGDSSAPGSVFFKSVFETPDDLLAHINSFAPSETILQGNNRMALVFHMTEAVGTSGLAKRRDVAAEKIVFESRNGFQVEVALLDKLDLAYEFCVIVENREEEEHLITAFPGEYSLSFPYEGQNPEEYERSRLFWQEHILCRKINFEEDDKAK